MIDFMVSIWIIGAGVFSGMHLFEDLDDEQLEREMKIVG